MAIANSTNLLHCLNSLKSQSLWTNLNLGIPILSLPLYPFNYHANIFNRDMSLFLCHIPNIALFLRKFDYMVFFASGLKSLIQVIEITK
jgi:hypothetical protein